MRTKQVPITLPDEIREWYDEQAYQSGVPLATYLRMVLVRQYAEAVAAPAIDTPAAGNVLTNDDGPDLNNVW
jgi:hypothetical protein